MAQEQERPKSAKEDVGEAIQKRLPRLTDVITDYEELSPFYQRSFSAPAAGVDQQRQLATAARELERHRSDLPTHPSESSLPPPVKSTVVRTFPGAGSREPYQSPYDITSEPRPSGVNIAIERSQSDRPSIQRRQTEASLPRSPAVRRTSSPRLYETRATQSRPSVYDPIYEEQEPRGTRTLPPIETPVPPAEQAGEAPAAPQYQPLPGLRPVTSYPTSSPRYVPYSIERPPPHEPVPPPRRRYSHTLPREYPRPVTPTSGPPPPTSYLPHRSPTVPTRPPPLPPSYPPDQYAPYPPPVYATRGQRRPSYDEERRHGRHEAPRYPPPIPYGSSSYPPSYPYEYSGVGRGYYDPYGGYVEYHASRRLSQQESVEQVTHLGVPERSYQPPIHGPTSPSTMRAQPPHSAAMPSVTPGKRRGNLPKESKDKLKLWLSTHVEHPYPTEEEKKELAAEAGMTMGQINNWFINARRRTLPRIPGRSGSPPTSRTLRRRPGDS